MMPLSIVFRVDATDSNEARRQLEEVVVTATAIRDGLDPGRPVTGLMQVVTDAQAAKIRERGGLGLPPAPPSSRPWDADRRGMGE